jgi:hypothetical protein
MSTEVPAYRLLLLNGPHYVGKRTLDRQLRDRWRVMVLDAEAIGFTLQEGTPAALAPGDLQDNTVWLWSLWRLGVELSRAFGFAVLAATVYRPGAVADLLGRFGQAGVDVLHVVMEPARPHPWPRRESRRQALGPGAPAPSPGRPP